MGPTNMVFFAQKTPDFGPKNRLRIWGVPPSHPLRTKFSAKRGLRIWGVAPPPLTDKIRKVVFDLAPYWGPTFGKTFSTAW